VSPAVTEVTCPRSSPIPLGLKVLPPVGDLPRREAPGPGRRWRRAGSRGGPGRGGRASSAGAIRAAREGCVWVPAMQAPRRPQDAPYGKRAAGVPSGQVLRRARQGRAGRASGGGGGLGSGFEVVEHGEDRAEHSVPQGALLPFPEARGERVA
jgi:hypothetical protein